MPRPKIILSKDRLLMLGYLLDSAPSPRKPSVVSIDQIAGAVGVSSGKVKYLIREFVDTGLLEVEPRFLPNGGQAENAYRLTRKGRNRLKTAATVSE